jgi:hypothetical protein
MIGAGRNQKMPDMLVKLRELPETGKLIEQISADGIIIKRAISPEKALVVDWVRKNFNRAWSGECDVCFSNKPVSCYLALKKGQILGFACYESVCKGFFGPTGVKKKARGLGIGKALLLVSLEAMRNEGYMYAIIGGVGPADFYARAAGAVMIEGSGPGVYKDMVE